MPRDFVRLPVVGVARPAEDDLARPATCEQSARTAGEEKDAHVTVLPRDEVCILAGRLFEAHRLVDPRRAHENALTAHSVHVFVLHAAEHACGKPRANDERVYRALGRLAERECLNAALDYLVDVLHGAADDRPTTAKEARKEIVEVGRCVDCVCVEDVA